MELNEAIFGRRSISISGLSARPRAARRDYSFDRCGDPSAERNELTTVVLRGRSGTSDARSNITGSQDSSDKRVPRPRGSDSRRSSEGSRAGCSTKTPRSSLDWLDSYRRSISWVEPSRRSSRRHFAYGKG